MIEFQKRGLPHCHVLIHFQKDDKLKTQNDRLSYFCRNLAKLLANSAYPEYWRCNLPNRVVEKKGRFGTVYLKNRYVVSYNPYLKQKFNCHINVESCYNIKSIKYIYNYVYKSHNEGALKVNQGTGEHSRQQPRQQPQHHPFSLPPILSLKSFYIYNDVIFNFTICSLKRVLHCLWKSGTIPIFTVFQIIYGHDCRCNFTISTAL